MAAHASSSCQTDVELLRDILLDGSCVQRKTRELVWQRFMPLAYEEPIPEYVLLVNGSLAQLARTASDRGVCSFRDGHHVGAVRRGALRLQASAEMECLVLQNAPVRRDGQAS